MRVRFRRLAILASIVLGSLAAAAPAPEAPAMQLFLLIGQSNMAGRGEVEEADRVPHPRVFMLDREMAWVPAVDPMHFDKPALAGTGLGTTFGRVLAEEDPQAVIGLIPAAFGGSALEEWMPGTPAGKHYRNAVARAREGLKRGRLAGILWHQGEADSAPERAASYADRFARLVARLRADLDAADVPVIVGETGRFRRNGAAINAVLGGLPAQVPRCGFVSSEGLADKGDQVHFNRAALAELGRRYARAWRDLASPTP